MNAGSMGGGHSERGGPMHEHREVDVSPLLHRFAPLDSASRAGVGSPQFEECRYRSGFMTPTPPDRRGPPPSGRRDPSPGYLDATEQWDVSPRGRPPDRDAGYGPPPPPRQ